MNLLAFLNNIESLFSEAIYIINLMLFLVKLERLFIILFILFILLIGLIILLIFEIIFIVIILIIVVVLLRPALGLASALHLLREECKYLIVGGGGLRNELFEFLHICLLQAFYALDLYFLLTQSTRYL